MDAAILYFFTYQITQVHPAKQEIRKRKNKLMKKLIAMILTLVMIFSVSLAFARTIEPDDRDTDHLAGKVVHASVGTYNAETKTFHVTLYGLDVYEIEDVEKIGAGDTILAGGRLFRVKEIEKDQDGDYKVTTEDGDELVFVGAGDENMILQYVDDDRRFMSVFAELSLPAAEGIVYEDSSDPDSAESVVTKGLDGILKIQAEKEENSIGFHYYSTIIELNEQLEIVRIHQDFDVAQ